MGSAGSRKGRRPPPAADSPRVKFGHLLDQEDPWPSCVSTCVTASGYHVLVSRADSKNKRRAEILAVARKILAKKGLEATTVSEVVAQAGVAQGTFYLYFPSKALLVVALGEQMTEDIFRAVQKATTRAENLAGAIEAGVRSAFEEMGHYKDVLAVIHASVSLVTDPLEWDRRLEPYYQFIAGLIEDGIKSGEVDPTVDPDLSARLVYVMVHRTAEHHYLYNPNTLTEPYIEEAIGFVQRALLTK